MLASQARLKARKAGVPRFIERLKRDPFIRARDSGEQPGRTKLPVWARSDAHLKQGQGKSKKGHAPSLKTPEAEDPAASETLKHAHLAKLAMDDVSSWRARSAFKLMEIQKGTRMLAPSLNMEGGAGVGAAVARAIKSGREVQVETVQKEGAPSAVVERQREQASEGARVVPWIVVDLGAAPGGWSQVCARALSWWESTRARGTRLAWHVFGIDLLPVSDLPGATFLRGDFLAQSTRKQLRDQILAALPPPDPRAHGSDPAAFHAAAATPSTSVVKDTATGEVLSGGLVDVCLSDMLGNVSGVDARDETISVELVDAAFRFARRTLRWPPPLPVALPSNTGTKAKLREDLKDEERFEPPPARGHWEEAPEAENVYDAEPGIRNPKPDRSQRPLVPRTTYFVAKVYQSKLSERYVTQILRPFFERLVIVKPEATRAVSREQFIVASGFRGPQAANYGKLRESFAERHGV